MDHSIKTIRVPNIIIVVAEWLKPQVLKYSNNIRVLDPPNIANCVICSVYLFVVIQKTIDASEDTHKKAVGLVCSVVYVKVVGLIRATTEVLTETKT